MSKKTKNFIPLYFRHNSFIQEAKKLLTEERRIEKELLKKHKDIRCPQKVEIERFVEGSAVKDVIQGIMRKRKIDNREECVVARAYLTKRSCRTLEDM